MDILEVLLLPRTFFERLKLAPVQLAVPCLLLFSLWVLSSAVPLLLGVLLQPDLLASLISSAVAFGVLIACVVLLAGNSRVLEVLGFAVLPLILAFMVSGGLWFLGSVAQGLVTVSSLVALMLTFRAAFVGVLVMAESTVTAWRTVLLAPLLTFVFMAVPFGLLVTWLGLT